MIVPQLVLEANTHLFYITRMTMFLTTPSGHAIAYQHQLGEGRGVLFCGGYRSDMNSTKGTALAEFCREQHIPFLRFDYFGHGHTDGDFIDFTIGAALADTLAVLDELAPKEITIIGSSMGGWIALLAALARPQQVKALIGIASAPDFSDRLMYQQLPPAMRATLEQEGVIYVPSDFSEDYPLTMKFITEARQHLLLDHPIPLSIPIHLLHGQDDADVPWQMSLEIAEKLTGDDVTTTLIKDGDHRLSRPQDLALLMEAVKKLR